MLTWDRWASKAAAAGVLALALAAGLAAQPAPARAARTLGVEVWTDRGDDAVYQPGDAMTVKVRASDDAYLLVYEIDSEGKISVLYPWRRGSNLVEGHRTLRMPPDDSGYELAVETATGEGYLVAIASRRPFRDLPWYLRTFDPQAADIGYENRRDDEDGFDDDGKVVGDPMVAMERIRRRVLDRPSDTDDFASSYATYYVGHEVRYPRYICADCHRRDQWAWWDGFDPYYTRCSVFDFRVNWNWCWGPCIWGGGYVPYYYYVVRNDCPPRYRHWYEDRSRWSSWDGYSRFHDLWGGNLRRYKSDPPAGYTPPPPSGKPLPIGYRPGEPQPPGYLPPSGGGRTYRPGGGGFREPRPIGRPVNPVYPGSPREPIWRQPPTSPGEPGSGREKPPGLSDRPGERAPGEVSPPRNPESPRQDPAWRPTQPPRQEKPQWQGRQEQPRREPPRQEQPRQEQPKREQPRQEQPRQEQPRHDEGNSRTKGDGGGGRHEKK